MKTTTKVQKWKLFVLFAIISSFLTMTTNVQQVQARTSGSYTINGTIRDPDGNPEEGVSVKAYFIIQTTAYPGPSISTSYRLAGEITTVSNGYYSFNSISTPLAPYYSMDPRTQLVVGLSVSVSHPIYFSASRSVSQPIGGSSYTWNFNLDAKPSVSVGPFTLKGIVKDASTCVAIPNALAILQYQVQIYNRNDGTITPIEGWRDSTNNDTTDVSGRYIFQNIYYEMVHVHPEYELLYQTRILVNIASHKQQVYELPVGVFNDFPVDEAVELRTIYMEKEEGINLEWQSHINEDNVKLINTGSPDFPSFFFEFEFLARNCPTIALTLNGHIYGGIVPDAQSAKLAIEYKDDDSLDGRIPATLTGYGEDGNFLVDHSIYLNFIWIKDSNDVVLETCDKTLPQTLYMIFHDPSGDQSYSYYKEEHSVKLGLAVEAEFKVTAGVKVESELTLFGYTVGEAAQETKVSVGVAGEHTVDIELKSTQQLQSSGEKTDPAFIGPGNGDIYWGEAWEMKFQLVEPTTIYMNKTTETEPHKLLYGIMRSSEVVLSSLTAPTAWKEQNILINGDPNIDNLNWSPLSHSGSAPIDSGHEITTDTTHKVSLEISKEDSAMISLLGIEGSLTVETSIKVSGSLDSTDITEMGYHLEDDEGEDNFNIEIATDPIFGTPIFRTLLSSQSSYPIEQFTRDYQGPEIIAGIPVFHEADNTFEIYTTVTDETGILSVRLVYSQDNGISFKYFELPYVTTNIWGGNFEILPVTGMSGILLWKIEATDNSPDRIISETESFEYILPIIENPPAMLTILNGYPIIESNNFVVKADIVDDEGILSAKLMYSLDGGVSVNFLDLTNMNLNEWSAQVAMGTVSSILWKILVIDTSGQVSESSNAFSILNG